MVDFLPWSPIEAVLLDMGGTVLCSIYGSIITSGATWCLIGDAEQYRVSLMQASAEVVARTQAVKGTRQ
ncbi:MAG: hypothetical protein CSA09_03595 [Candidatus Contendobacter odensis]|uniref:Uncharacterized protein n=1 Tax=Candidatus Contendibacter odensensis TaxID=1400860 RepID=A0A2G6PG52_9GAMM|nr:MAG: hypothetical protein CSA09_03595 [Candidatus Contendobacter odensis]